jgi:hypothetical protein
MEWNYTIATYSARNFDNKLRLLRILLPMLPPYEIKFSVRPYTRSVKTFTFSLRIVY